MWFLLMTTSLALAADDSSTYTPWSGAELKVGTEETDYTMKWSSLTPLEQQTLRLDVVLSGTRDESVADLFSGLTPASGVEAEVFLGIDQPSTVLRDLLDTVLAAQSVVAFAGEPAPALAQTADIAGLAAAWQDDSSEAGAALRNAFKDKCTDVPRPAAYPDISERDVSDQKRKLNDGSNVLVEAQARLDELVARLGDTDGDTPQDAAGDPDEDPTVAPAPVENAEPQELVEARRSVARATSRLHQARADLERWECGRIQSVLSGDIDTANWRSSSLKSFRRTGIQPTELGTSERELLWTYGVEFQGDYTSVKAFDRTDGVLPDEPTPFVDYSIGAGPRIELMTRDWGLMTSMVAGADQSVKTEDAVLCESIDAGGTLLDDGSFDRAAESCSEVKLLKLDDDGTRLAPTVAPSAAFRLRTHWLFRPKDADRLLDAVPGLEIGLAAEELLEAEPTVKVRAGSFVLKTEGKAPVRTGLFFEQGWTLGDEIERNDLRGYAIIGASL